MYVRKITIPARRHLGLHKTCCFLLLFFCFFFGWCCQHICLVFSFKLPLPPNTEPIQRCVHAVYTVQTNVIFWLPSSAVLRNVRRGNQQSSAAYSRYINTVCSRQTPIFVEELSQHIRHINVARLQWWGHVKPDFQYRVPVHTNMAWRSIMMFYHICTKWFICFGLTLEQHVFFLSVIINSVNWVCLLSSRRPGSGNSA